jgi:hypothetical protein
MAKPEDAQCTGAELEDFFGCIWITRIWTLQEVVMSPNPVIVRGQAHIPWNRFAYSVVFLASHRLTPSLREWVGTVFTKELYQAGVGHTSEYDSRLTAYWSFCVSIRSRYRPFRRLNLWLVLALFVITSVPVVHKVRKSSRVFPLVVTLVLIWWFPLCIALYVVFVRSLAPNPGYSSTGELDTYLGGSPLKQHTRISIHDRILESLSTRNATDPRDMSFGIYSILERVIRHQNLPSLNHEIPLYQSYHQLTRCLLEDMTSLKLLIMAAQMPCMRGPSWVPNYSQKLQYDIPLHFDATPKSKAYYSYHPSKDGVLVVKGMIIGTVLYFGRERGASSRTIWEGQGSKLQFPIYTTCGHGSSSSSFRIGDKVALIAGVTVPLLLRRVGDHVKIIAIAEMERRIGEDRSHTMHGDLWRAAEESRRANWLEKHSSQTDSQIIREPDPAEYLDDILIA